MSNVFKTAEKILTAETDNLLELAKIAGIDPRKMYFQADLSGADLRLQDISFLVGLRANYSEAILTTEQRSYLATNDTYAEDGADHGELRLLGLLRLETIEDYLNSLSHLKDTDPLYDRLLQPLQDTLNAPISPSFEVNYVRRFVRELAKSWPARLMVSEQKELLGALTRARFQFYEACFDDVDRFLPETIKANNFIDVFDLASCSLGFVSSVLDEAASRGKSGFAKLATAIVESFQELPDKLAATILNNEPRQDLTVAVLKRLSENSLVKEKIALAKVLCNRSFSGAAVKLYSEALSNSPSIRMAYLSTTMKSQNTELAIVALQERLRLPRPLGTIELSDIAYHLPDQPSRIRYANRTQSLLSAHQHRILVIEIEKIAKTLGEHHRIRQTWPEYFGRQ